MILFLCYLFLFYLFLKFKTKLFFFQKEKNSNSIKIFQSLCYWIFFILFLTTEFEFQIKIIFLCLVLFYFIFESYLIDNSYLLVYSLGVFSITVNFLFGLDEGLSAFSNNFFVNLLNYSIGGIFCLISFIKRKYYLKKDFAIYFDKVAMLVLTLNTIVSIFESSGNTRAFYISLTFLIQSYFLYLGFIYNQKTYWFELILTLIIFIYVFFNFENIMNVQKERIELIKSRMQNK